MHGRASRQSSTSSVQSIAAHACAPFHLRRRRDPTQFEVWLSDSSFAYVRFRSVVLTVDFGAADWLAGADGATWLEYEPAFSDTEGDALKRRKQCSWAEAQPYLVHALVLAAGRQLAPDGYISIECTPL